MTGQMPKPMVPVGDRPLLWHVMQIYARQGHTRFVLCLGYMGDAIRQWFSENAPGNWDIVFAETGQDTPTGGRILAASTHLNPGPFFATYGDGVGDVDLDGLQAFHSRQNVHATLCAMRPRSRFGVVELAAGRVTRFEEKPLLTQRISGGFFLFEQSALGFLRRDEALERGALGRLASEQMLAGYPHDGFWMSVDTPRDLQELESSWQEGVRPWLVS
jgi:glucose-1-phosphate cytidylyltransferase